MLVHKNKIIYENNKRMNIVYTNPFYEINDISINENCEFKQINYKVGLCFKIYVNERTKDVRYNIIKDFLKSLEKILDCDNLIVYGIIDCIPNDKLKNILKDIDQKINLYYLNGNYGISTATNIGIEILLDKGCDYIFCSDDDVLFLDQNIFNHYIKNAIKYKFHHLSYYPIKFFNTIKETINKDIYYVYGYSGCFYLLTRYVILTQGYIPILNSKYGYEHEIFTKNITNKQYDLNESHKYITLNELSVDNCSGSKLDCLLVIFFVNISCS